MTLASPDVADLSDDLDAELASNSIVDPRTVPARFSNLKAMAASALHYHQACQTNNEQTLAMRFGAGVHALVLGTPYVVWHGKDRRAKGYKDFAAYHADVPILTLKEDAAAQSLASAIMRHPLAYPLLFGYDATIEQQIEWSWMGKACTSRPDSRQGSKLLADLKTTQCADPVRFGRDAIWRGYHAQLAYYAMAIEHLTGSQPNDLYIVAVESKRPHAITVMQVSDEARDQGMRLCRTWFERLLVCEHSNVWPAYSESIVRLDPLGDDLNITIGGIALNDEEQP